MAEVNHFHGLQPAAIPTCINGRWRRPPASGPGVAALRRVKGELGTLVAENRQDMQRARWFPDSQLNFAENLLRRQDESPAIISLH